MYLSSLKGDKRRLSLALKTPMTSCQPTHQAQGPAGHWMTRPDSVDKLLLYNFHTPRGSGRSQAHLSGPET